MIEFCDGGEEAAYFFTFAGRTVRDGSSDGLRGRDKKLCDKGLALFSKWPSAHFCRQSVTFERPPLQFRLMCSLAFTTTNTCEEEGFQRGCTQKLRVRMLGQQGWLLQVKVSGRKPVW